jgi:S1-C subfamily serine protease
MADSSSSSSAELQGITIPTNRFDATPQKEFTMKTRVLALSVPLVSLGTWAVVACFSPDSKAVPPPRAAEGFELRPEEKQVVDIFREASPSVVFISSSIVRRNYFSRILEEIPRGTGSGFVWDKDGHVVTNYHVVADYVENPGRNITLTVALDDRSEYKVERVVGTYPDKELAVLMIKAPPEKLQPIRLGRSKDILVGQTVLAIGNPFGLDHTLTLGIVSAVGREIQAMNQRRISDVIQTDAAINPGNSGGPLLNSSGQLVGMNTAILSPSGVNAGIGFAIPIDTLARYTDQLIRYEGRVKLPGLGIVLFPDFVTRQLGVTGVLINKVPTDSAAAKSALKGTTLYEDGEVQELGDLIVAVDGKKVTDFVSLRDILDAYAIGDEVEVTYLRGKKQETAKLRLQEIER